MTTEHSKTHRTAIVIVGPTASGKTHLSLLLNEYLPVEFVSADSRQVYRYMDIGTAKPAAEILKKYPHHFIDTLTPDTHFSAGEFCEQGRKIVDQIFDRGNVPVIVGGSGLYIRALLKGFFGADVRDEKLRSDLEERLEKEGNEALYRELCNIDPSAAEKIHPNNIPRLLRALEVYYSGGKPISQLQNETEDLANFEYIKFGVNKPRDLLYKDINQRVDKMIEAGLIDEVRKLLEMDYSPELNSLNTVGYKEIIQHLKGEISLERSIELIKRNSRRYAKRQMTWFNADPEIEWLHIEKLADYDTAAKYVYQQFIKISS